MTLFLLAPIAAPLTAAALALVLGWRRLTASATVLAALMVLISAAVLALNVGSGARFAMIGLRNQGGRSRSLSPWFDHFFLMKSESDIPPLATAVFSGLTTGATATNRAANHALRFFTRAFSAASCACSAGKRA